METEKPKYEPRLVEALVEIASFEAELIQAVALFAQHSQAEAIAHLKEATDKHKALLNALKGILQND